jgi:hypothetical protein
MGRPCGFVRAGVKFRDRTAGAEIEAITVGSNRRWPVNPRSGALSQIVFRQFLRGYETIWL